MASWNNEKKLKTMNHAVISSYIYRTVLNINTVIPLQSSKQLYLFCSFSDCLPFTLSFVELDCLFSELALNASIPLIKKKFISFIIIIINEPVQNKLTGLLFPSNDF